MASTEERVLLDVDRERKLNMTLMFKHLETNLNVLQAVFLAISIMIIAAALFRCWLTAIDALRALRDSSDTRNNPRFALAKAPSRIQVNPSQNEGCVARESAMGPGPPPALPDSPVVRDWPSQSLSSSEEPLYDDPALYSQPAIIDTGESQKADNLSGSGKPVYCSKKKKGKSRLYFADDCPTPNPYKPVKLPIKLGIKHTHQPGH